MKSSLQTPAPAHTKYIVAAHSPIIFPMLKSFEYTSSFSWLTYLPSAVQESCRPSHNTTKNMHVRNSGHYTTSLVTIETTVWNKLPAAKMRTARNENIFKLLHKLLAKQSCEHPPTAASTNYRSSTPSLPTMPFPDKNDSKWSWLIVVCLGAMWGAPRRPWDDGRCHSRNVCLCSCC